MAGAQKQTKASRFLEFIGPPSRVAVTRKAENPFLRREPAENVATNDGSTLAKKRTGVASTRRSPATAAKRKGTGTAKRRANAAKSVTSHSSPGSVPFPKR